MHANILQGSMHASLLPGSKTVFLCQVSRSFHFSLQEVEAMNAFNQEMLMAALPAAFEGAFAQMLHFLKRRDILNMDCLYNLLKQPGSSNPAADIFAKVSYLLYLSFLNVPYSRFCRPC